MKIYHWILIAVIMTAVIGFASAAYSSQYKYGRGLSGTKCYYLFDSPIHDKKETAVKFKTLEACENSLEK